MVTISTPERSRWTAALCLYVWGWIRLAPSVGAVGCARAEYRRSKYRTPKRVIGWPTWLRNTAQPSAADVGVLFRRAWIASAVSGHRGHNLSLRPLPTRRTKRGGSS